MPSSRPSPAGHPSLSDPLLARTLVLDELFDLSLYKALRNVTDPDVHPTLDELVAVEIGHLAFWKNFSI